jgi:TatD DNase family protein
MFTWFDAHTHHSGLAREGVYAQYNVRQDFGAVHQACSMGLHPWYLQDNDITALEPYAASPLVKAIGECGLDKITATPWNLQLAVFRAQVQLAMSLQKPLIIHCVRAFNEVLQVLKEEQVNVPVIFHGFNRKRELAEQLFDAGYYLSFGAALLQPDSNAAAVWSAAPAEQVFLETDDAPQDIETIYTAAAGIRKTSINTIILQLQKNATTVFDL